MSCTSSENDSVYENEESTKKVASSKKRKSSSVNNPPRKRRNTRENNAEINPEGKKAFLMRERRDKRLNL